MLYITVPEGVFRLVVLNPSLYYVPTKSQVYQSSYAIHKKKIQFKKINTN